MNPVWKETYTPRIPKINFIDPNKNNRNPTSHRMRLPTRTETAIQRCDDNVRDAHSDGSDYKDWLTPELVDVEDGWDGGEEHEDTADAAG